jgi:hypothetical protein
MGLVTALAISIGLLGGIATYLFLSDPLMLGLQIGQPLSAGPVSIIAGARAKVSSQVCLPTCGVWCGVR